MWSNCSSPHGVAARQTGIAIGLQSSAPHGVTARQTGVASGLESSCSSPHGVAAGQAGVAIRLESSFSCPQRSCLVAAAALVIGGHDCVEVLRGGPLHAPTASIFLLLHCLETLAGCIPACQVMLCQHGILSPCMKSCHIWPAARD